MHRPPVRALPRKTGREISFAERIGRRNDRIGGKNGPIEADCRTSGAGSVRTAVYNNKNCAPETVRFYPCRLQGVTEAPASKSELHRALLLAALCGGNSRTEIRSYGACGEDVLATAACIRSLGGTAEQDGELWTVSPCAGTDTAHIDCGESGTTLRFLLPAASFFAKKCLFTGCGRLPERPIGPLTDALEKNGLRFSAKVLPFTVTGRMRAGDYTLPGNVSSQFISALIIAAPLTGNAVRVRVTGRTESLGYIDMTRDAMERFGVKTSCDILQTERVYTVNANGYTAPAGISVEGDWSSALPFLALQRLGHAIRVEGLNAASRQPDARCGRLFDRVGTGTDIDVSGCPDMMPVLAALAACTEGETHITGAARLRYKESDRLSSMADVLTRLGVRVTEREDGLTVFGGTVHGGMADAHRDHRVAMALAVLACEADGPVTVTGFDCIEKSRPDFLSAFGKLGGRFDELTVR